LTPKELRSKRMDLGWSQKQLADRCGIDLKRILDFEDGEAAIDCEDLLERALKSEADRVE
jgi:transcriptional regulator with XRE-family HTH domain